MPHAAQVSPSERRPSLAEGYCSCGQIARHVCDACVRWTCESDLVRCADCRKPLCCECAATDDGYRYCAACAPVEAGRDAA